MDLERLSIALRPRNAWEAIDLGMRLAMRNAQAIYPTWLVCCITLAVILFGGGWLLDIDPVWSMLLLWWLRPLSDRVILHQVSHIVFGETPGLRATLRALPRLLWRSGLVGDLLWRRFDLRRGLRMPVVVLEGLRGKPARQRRKLLSGKVSGSATWLTAGLSQLETLCCLGGLTLIFMLLPESVRSNFSFRDVMAGQSKWFEFCYYLLYLCAHLFLEPIYVAASFMLYLKRRNDLEAWDIELQFRRLNEAQQARQHDHVAPASALLMLLLALPLAFALLTASPPASAEPQTDTAREQRVEAAPQVVRKILEDPVFGKEESSHELRWKPLDIKGPDFSSPDWLEQWFKSVGKFIGGVARILAVSGRIIGWIALSIVIGVLLWLLWREIRRRSPRTSSFVPLGELAGFDIRPESLPDDVARAARELLATGRSREAMSLLFRGALSALAWRDHVPFAPGDTEGDCLDRVHRHAPGCFAPLARLLSSWQTLAWAHRAVSTSEVEALCDEWPRHFSKRSEA